MFGSTIILCLGEEERHAHVCPCSLHLLNESVGSLTGRANVINQQHPLALEIVAVYLHVALRLLAVLAADMHLFALSDHLDMLKAVDGSTLGAHVSREPLVSAVVRALATGRDANDDGIRQVHLRESLAYKLRSPMGSESLPCLEPKQKSVGLLRLEVRLVHVPLRNVV